MKERYDPHPDRRAVAALLGSTRTSSEAVEDPQKEKYYLLEMFPYPSGKAPHGAYSQLLHRRRRGPL